MCVCVCVLHVLTTEVHDFPVEFTRPRAPHKIDKRLRSQIAGGLVAVVDHRDGILGLEVLSNG